MPVQQKADMTLLHVDALILKGGGVKGLAFAGAVSELQARYEFQTFVGTSAGAIAAALLAAGASGPYLEDRLRQKPFRDFLDGWTWTAFVTIPLYGGIHRGLAITNWVRKELSGLLGKRNEVQMKDLPKRAVIYASQANRDPITFDTIGQHNDLTVHYAVRCSLSIPYFFRPELDQQWVYDGGLLNNFPIEIFLAQERERRPGKEPNFIALYLGTVEPPPIKLGWQFPTLLNTWIERNDRDVIERHRSRTIVIDTEPIKTIDFNLTNHEKDFLVLVGRASALEFLRARGLLNESEVSSVTCIREKAERLRPIIFEERKRGRRRYLARALAALAAVFRASGGVFIIAAPRNVRPVPFAGSSREIPEEIKMTKVVLLAFSSLLAVVIPCTKALAGCPSPLPDRPSPSDLRECFNEIAELRKIIERQPLVAVVIEPPGLPNNPPKPFINNGGWGPGVTAHNIPGSQNFAFCSISGVWINNGNDAGTCELSRSDSNQWSIDWNKGARCRVTCFMNQMVPSTPSSPSR
jgi:predicted acylesterase/phospholipase RssA